MSKVNVIKDNQIQEADSKDVDVELISPTQLVGTHANVVPMFNNAQSARLFYASRFVDQAMPLTNRETPLVQSLDPNDPDGKSFEEKYGKRVGAKFSPTDGEVVETTPDFIRIKDSFGKEHRVDLYNNFQFNRKTQISNKTVVKPGDKIKKGQILAGSNFTDDNGTLSMGVNARIAMVPYLGYSMDDAIVVSESFSKKLASEHSYEHDLEKSSDTKTGKKHFYSLFPSKFTKAQLDTLDENGIVKPGTVLQYGDPILLATRPKPVYSNATHLGKLGKTFRSIRGDASQVWEHDYPGVVVDSVNGKKNSKVFINATSPLVPGDKIILRNGQKDILSKVIPDEQMLRSLDGKPFEVLLNPLALPSRVNTATLYELALGKIAAKTGKPIKMPSFTKKGESRLAYVLKRLQEEGLSDTEEVFDPVSNTKLERPVTTGIGYIEKLHHVVDTKMSARGQGSYDCYDDKTEVLTKRGWMLWKDVNYTDEFYTCAAGGDKAFYAKASSLVRYFYKGPMFKLTSDDFDLFVSPGHKQIYYDVVSNIWTEEKIDILFNIYKKTNCNFILPKITDGKMVKSCNTSVKFTKQDYIGYIYCATIPETGLLCVRRNNKEIISGNSNQQPLKGGSDTAQAKRLGSLETTALLAKGGYATLREGSTLRGQQNDDYWRLLRQGYKPAEPGTPFVFDKFRILLNGAGLNSKDLGDGKLRLGPLTDRDLDSFKPVEIKNGKLVDTVTLDGVADGLFDPKIVALNKWGKITLSHPMPNPAFEKQICQILGITVDDLRAVIAGDKTLDQVQNKKK